MRIIGYIFTALLAIAAMCSCTHNTGDIGPLFGQWKTTDIATTAAATGTVTHNATSGAFLSFQNDVVTLTQVYDGQHQSALSYGQWELNGNSLTLYFDISDGVSLPGAMRLRAGYDSYRQSARRCSTSVLYFEEMELTGAQQAEASCRTPLKYLT